MGRLAVLVLRYRARQGEERLRRRLGAAGLAARQIDAAFRFAAFLAVRPEAAVGLLTKGAMSRPAPRPAFGGLLAAMGFLSWTILIGVLISFRLWATAVARQTEPMPEDLLVRDAVALYKPPVLGRPFLLEELLGPRTDGNACADYLAAAHSVGSDTQRLLKGGWAPQPSVADLELGLGKRDCAILGELATPETEDDWARLRLAVALVDRLGEALARRAEGHMASGRFDLAYQDALEELALGRHLAEDWLPESQAAGSRHLERGLEWLTRAVSARGLYDAETRIRLGKIRAETRAYAADPTKLARVAGVARDPSDLPGLRLVFEAEPNRRPYAQATLSAAAMAWSLRETQAGRPDPRRAEWLAETARSSEPRVAALAWAQLRRLARAERTCRDLSPKRRLIECPLPRN